jgi:uncharacterized membrane protein
METIDQRPERYLGLYLIIIFLIMGGLWNAYMIHNRYHDFRSLISIFINLALIIGLYRRSNIARIAYIIIGIVGSIVVLLGTLLLLSPKAPSSPTWLLPLIGTILVFEIWSIYYLCTKRIRSLFIHAQNSAV